MLEKLSAGLYESYLTLDLGDISYIPKAPPHLLSHLIFIIGITLTDAVAGDGARKALGV